MGKSVQSKLLICGHRLCHTHNWVQLYSLLWEIFIIKKFSGSHKTMKLNTKYLQYTYVFECLARTFPYYSTHYRTCLMNIVNLHTKRMILDEAIGRCLSPWSIQIKIFQVIITCSIGTAHSLSCTGASVYCRLNLRCREILRVTNGSGKGGENIS